MGGMEQRLHKTRKAEKDLEAVVEADRRVVIQLGLVELLEQSFSGRITPRKEGQQWTIC